MLSALTTIKERLATRRLERDREQLRGYWDLVTAIADGEEPEPEEVDRLVGEYVPPPPIVCPRNAAHSGPRVLGGDDETLRCVCDSCGERWSQPVPQGEGVNDARKTIVDLERDVSTLLQRRRWREQLDQVPQLEERRRQARAKLADAQRAIEEAVAARNAIAADVGPELQRLDRALSDARAARKQLLGTAMRPEIVERWETLDQLRKQKGLRKTAIKRDLWGHSRVGEFTDVHADTTGSRVVQLQINIDRIDPSDTHNRSRAAERYAHYWQRRVQPLIDEYEQLETELPELEAAVAALETEKLNP